MLTLQENLISGSAHPSGAPDFRICLPFRQVIIKGEQILKSGAPEG
jgi:hypothetical protein